jgi:hypothetical protein
MLDNDFNKRPSKYGKIYVYSMLKRTLWTKAKKETVDML